VDEQQFKNYSIRLGRIAAEIQATELAAFSIDPKNRLWTVCHIRPHPSDFNQRKAAIEAFNEIVGKLHVHGDDGVIEISEKPAPANPQFCIVTFARDGGKIVGAAAFICRCANLKAAKVLLRQIQESAA
jgi:hypothetical protein